MTKTRKVFLPLLMMALVFILAVVMTAQIEAATTVEPGLCGANLTYTLDSDGVLTISGTGAMAYWSWPSDAPWYLNRSLIKAVRINSGVTSIGDYAFYGCTNLSSITIPDSVTSIDWYAFYDCTSLSSITIPDSVTSIDYRAFYNCTGLSGITIGDSVTSIGKYAFEDCTSLSSITIPDSVTSIGDSAFNNTAYYNESSNWENKVLYIGNHLIEAKTSISGWYVIKEGTKTIADNAFSNCEYLSSITIPDSVTSIGGSAFYGCLRLRSITIPDSVTSIGYRAFYNCTNLSSITIPDSVVSIGSSAFYNTAYYNESSNWENEVLYIGNHLIDAKTSISGSYVIKEGTKTIAECAFYDCTSLSSITIPDSVTSIGDYAFYGCTGLTSITIPDSVTSIGEETFSNCDSLISITIPDSVTSIGGYAFYGCTSLSSITVDKNNTKYSNDESGVLYNKDKTSLICCPAGTSMKSYAIPDSVTSIGGYAFRNCTSLSSITIPDSVTSIDWYAFEYCTSLISITIPDSVTSIGSDAFEDCTSLISITIGDGVTSIGDYAFYNCTSLSSITIPDSVTSIGELAFGYYCYSSEHKIIENFTIHGYTGSVAETYATDNGITFVALTKDENKCGDNLTYTLDSEGMLTISGTGDMYDYTTGTSPWYDQRDSITSVVIGDGVTCIGNSAFDGCSAITDVVISDSVTKIGERAFYGCTSLTEATIPKAVTIIRYAAFRGCTGLEKITIESLTTSFGTKVFGGCTKLTIYGYIGSKAETYAENNSITFVALDAEAECEHSFTVWKITEATCTADGIKTRSCTACGETETEVIPSTGHSYKATVTEPTCTEGGYTTHTCVNCGDTYTDSETEALGHDFGEWNVDVEPTVDAEGSRSRKCSCCGETETESIPKLEVEESGAVFTLSSENAKPGENVKITLSLKADTLISAIAISELVFDSEVLEFVGFGDYEQIEEKCSLPPVFDDELKCIVIALAEPEMFEGDICTLEFKVKEDATDCTTTVSAAPLTKLKSEVVKSELVDGEVEVYTYVKGDIDGDEDVDIDDAVYLLCHSMLPDYYPISYKGSLDIVPDGHIDQDDAVYLFNYSILPDIYPIG